jgi:hypothetical protein
MNQAGFIAKPTYEDYVESDLAARQIAVECLKLKV